MVDQCRSSRPDVFCKKGVLKHFTKFTGKFTCPRASILIKLQVSSATLKKTPAEVFSCEFREILKNSFFYRNPPVAAFQQRERLKLIFSWDGCRRLSLWQISDKPFEPAWNLNLGFVGASCIVATATTPWCRYIIGWK